MNYAKCCDYDLYDNLKKKIKLQIYFELGKTLANL